MTVLEELDHIKDRPEKTVSREARIAINMIDKIVDAASPQDRGEAPPGRPTMSAPPPRTPTGPHAANPARRSRLRMPPRRITR